MNIELLKGQYKSVHNLLWLDVPEFAVITGRNGSGKTQLLELLHYQLGTDGTHKGNVQRNPRDPFHTISMKVSNFSVQPNEVVFVPANYQLSNLGSINASQIDGIVNNLLNHIKNPNSNAQYAELAGIVIGRIGKPKDVIQKEDILHHLPVDYFDYLNKIVIHEGLQDIFLTYHCKAAEYRDEGKSKDEIGMILGEEPWEILNRLLDEAHFKYTVNRPKAYIGNYDFRLISRTDPNLIIDFSDLSSGEKMLISLAVWLFNANKAKRLPKLLLLDEPDAHLHPSAIKDFIDVIEKVLVRQHKVRVIMTTHSSSTVALSPEGALFEMSVTSPQVTPLKSKDYGINLLSEGLLTVRENTKYVLVEDSDDAKFYNEVYKILKQMDLLNPNIGILFLPSSNHKAGRAGGCSVVRGWVEKFVKEGLDNIFHGLIDLDNGTNDPENIPIAKNLHVLHRYSLENYLLDPILIYCSLLLENKPLTIPDVIFQQKDEHSITQKPVAILQKIADHIFADIEPLVANLQATDKQLEKVDFISGISLNYPKWFLNKRGHTLAGLFKSKYQPAIENQKLIATMIRHDLVPVDLLAIFKLIQA